MSPKSVPVWLSKLGFQGLPYSWPLQPAALQRHPERKTADEVKLGTKKEVSDCWGWPGGNTQPRVIPQPRAQSLWAHAGIQQLLLLRVTPELTYQGCPRRTQNQWAPHPKCPGKKWKAETLRGPFKYSTHHNTPRWWLSKQANKKASFVCSLQNSSYLRKRPPSFSTDSL